MRGILVTGVSAVAALLLAGSAVAIKLPAAPKLPADWSHAVINVVIDRQPHTLTYDRGRVQAVGSSSLTLKEPDGSVQTIAVSPSAKIEIAGKAGSLAQVHVRENAETVGVDGAPAVSVTVQIPPAVAAQIARQAARAARQQARQARRQARQARRQARRQASGL